MGNSPIPPQLDPLAREQLMQAAQREILEHYAPSDAAQAADQFAAQARKSALLPDHGLDVLTELANKLPKAPKPDPSPTR
jgi:hypothetical protein